MEEALEAKDEEYKPEAASERAAAEEEELQVGPLQAFGFGTLRVLCLRTAGLHTQDACSVLCPE